MGEILYIGKAKSLKKRVSSYFQKRRAGSKFWQNPKITLLVTLVHEIEFIITKNEVEALMLELNLIKKNRPRFNTDLKDDKSYPYIAFSKEPVPRIFITRELDQARNTYYGPFTNVRALRDTYHALRRTFPFRNCKQNKFTLHKKKLTPCLDHHIGLCVAPCANKVTETQYRKLIKEVSDFYTGNPDVLLIKYEEGMRAAARSEEFERAAQFRDRMLLIQRILSRQTVILNDPLSIDVIVSKAAPAVWFMTLLRVRNGRLIGSEHFEMGQGISSPVPAFIEKFYEIGTNIPKEIVVDDPFEDLELIQDYLSVLSRRKVKIVWPQRGPRRELLELAHENIEQHARTKLATSYLKAEETLKDIQDLAEALHLARLPSRIECYDVSNISGKFAVGSMSVSRDLVPRPAEYRRFKIHTRAKPDDVAMLAEVIERRLEHLKGGPSDDLSLSAVPDLIVIDGGKGQLSAVLSVLERSLAGENLPVVSLAKKNEEVFIPGLLEPLRMPRNSRALHSLQLVRDEAHRFALNYHHKLRDRETSRSVLDVIPGIGPVRKKLLFKRFGNVHKIGEASLEELREVLPENIAQTLHLYLRSES